MRAFRVDVRRIGGGLILAVLTGVVLFSQAPSPDTEALIARANP